MAARTFHPFFRLPNELHVEIWMLAMPPRNQIIRIWESLDFQPMDYNILGNDAEDDISQTAIRHKDKIMMRLLSLDDCYVGESMPEVPFTQNVDHYDGYLQQRQNQLEKYGFQSSQLAPILYREPYAPHWWEVHGTEYDRLRRLLQLEECEKRGEFVGMLPKSPWNVTIDHFSDHRQQSQLELFGFKSSLSALILCGLDEQKWRWWEKNRIAHFETAHQDVPVIQHVCHESRKLMESQGWGLAFSTRVSNPLMWFNFSHDYLRLDSTVAQAVTTALTDKGSWNIGQLVPEDLARLRKISLQSSNCLYFYGGEVPLELHMAVQICGNLTEILLAEFYSDPLNSMWFDESANANSVAVDICIEELLGHYPNWTPSTGRRDFEPWRFRDQPLTDFKDPLNKACQDMEEKIGNHKPLLPRADGSPNTWKTPKIRFVSLVTSDEEDGIAASRRYFREDVARWLQEPAVPSAADVYPDDDASEAVVREHDRVHYYQTRPDGWLKNALAMLDA